jgi:hypothetical protein
MPDNCDEWNELLEQRRKEHEEFREEVEKLQERKGKLQGYGKVRQRDEWNQMTKEIWGEDFYRRQQAILKKFKPGNGMNILPDQRIGWEKKQEYLENLAELSSQGYLTDDEWEARRKHIENAKTVEEIKIATSDLQSAIRLMEHERIAKAREASLKKIRRKKPTWPVLAIIVWDIAFIGMDIQSHMWWFLPIMIGVLAVTCVSFVKIILNNQGTS